MKKKEIEILEKYALWQEWLNSASKQPLYEKTGCGAVFCASCGVPKNPRLISTNSGFTVFCAGCTMPAPAPKLPVCH